MTSTGEGIDPPTPHPPWVFPACAAIPVQSLWTLHSLLQRWWCSWANLPWIEHLIYSPGPLMWIQCYSAYHSCLKVQLPQYSKVWSFTYCRCYNVIIWEPVMHYTFFIKEHHHLKVKCGKVSAWRYILTETVSETSGCGTKIVNISESALHLLLEGGKYPNKQNRITFDWCQPCHYKTNLVDWTLLRGHGGHDSSFSTVGPAIKKKSPSDFTRKLICTLGRFLQCILKTWKVLVKVCVLTEAD